MAEKAASEAPAAPDPCRMVTLTSKEGNELKVKYDIAMQSKMLREALEEDDDDEQTAIPVPNLDHATLKKAMEFAEHYIETKMAEIDKPLKSANLNECVDEWYARFVDMPQEELFALILGANYLDMRPLLDLACAKVASMIKGKSPQEIRQTFGINQDFTPEELRQIEEENKWCEEV